MKSKLAPLGIYSLKQDSVVFYELCAYAEGLSILEDYLDELESECFVATASDYGIYMRERLFSYKKDSLQTSYRRALLLYLMSVTSNDYTLSRMNKAIAAFGLEGEIDENPGTNSMQINCTSALDNIVSKADAVSNIKKFLPAHLEVTFNFGELSWEYFDSLDKTFGELEEQDLTWNEIDNYERV